MIMNLQSFGKRLPVCECVLFMSFGECGRFVACILSITAFVNTIAQLGVVLSPAGAGCHRFVVVLFRIFFAGSLVIFRDTELASVNSPGLFRGLAFSSSPSLCIHQKRRFLHRSLSTASSSMKFINRSSCSQSLG